MRLLEHLAPLDAGRREHVHVGREDANHPISARLDDRLPHKLNPVLGSSESHVAVPGHLDLAIQQHAPVGADVQSYGLIGHRCLDGILDTIR